METNTVETVGLTEVTSTVDTDQNSGLTEAQMSAISRLPLRDNILLILKSEERWFNFDELFKAAVDLKLDKGDAPSERGMKISLSRLSNPESKDSIFISDASGYFYTYRGASHGVAPAAPTGWKSTRKVEQSTASSTGGLVGRPSKVPVVEYQKVVHAIVSGTSVPNARLVNLRSETVEQLFQLLGSLVSKDTISNALVDFETNLQKQADEVVEVTN